MLSNNVNDWQQLFTLSVGLTIKNYSQFFSSRSLSVNCLFSCVISAVFSLHALHIAFDFTRMLNCSCHENFLPFLLTDRLKQRGNQCQLTIPVSFFSGSEFCHPQPCDKSNMILSLILFALEYVIHTGKFC